MPTRSQSTRGRAKTRTARKRTTRSTRAKNPVTVAARQISDSVNEVRRNPRKLKTIGKVAAVVAGLLVTRMISKRK